jgi:siroheme synthase
MFLDRDRRILPRIRKTRPQARMRTALIIMGLPFLQNSSQMTLADRDQKIETFPAYTANQPFAIRIRLGRTKRRFQDLYSHGLHTETEILGVNAVSSVNQKSVALLLVNGLAKLLQSPGCVGMGSNVEVDKSSRSMQPESYSAA